MAKVKSKSKSLKSQNKLKRKTRIVTRNVARVIKNQPLSNKIGIPTKIVLSFLLTYFIALSYFLLITYLEPRSIPALSNKINSTLQEKLGLQNIVSSTSVKFTADGYLQISSNDLQEIDLSSKQKYISKISLGEFSVFIPLSRLLLFDFKPSRISIKNSKIEANYNYQANAGDGNNYKDQLTGFIDDNLKKILVDRLYVNEISLENIDFIFKKKNEIYDRVNIKKSSLKLTKNRNIARFTSINNINFDSKKLDVYFNFGCQTGIKNQQYPQCDLMIKNIRANALAKTASKLNFLSPIDGAADISIFFKLTKAGLSDVQFDLVSNDGSFNYSQFFDNKIAFSNLKAKGSYHHKTGAINLSEVTTKLKSDHDLNHKNLPDIDLEMSLLISGLKAKEKQIFNFDIKLENVSGGEISRFWPISLPRQDIRDWVINHVDQGVIKKAYTSFRLSLNDNASNLDSIEAQINFSDVNLSYHEYFPDIRNIDGIASFDKGSMFIEIDDGEVLDTKIESASVTIEDFFAPLNFLHIRSKAIGKAEDLLKHINYKSQSSQNIKNYINGLAQSNTKIILPLSKKATLSDVLIDIESNISDINTDILAQSMQITCKKAAKSNIFQTKVNLADTKIIVPALGIEKEPQIPAKLNFDVVINKNDIVIDNIILAKTNDLSQFGGEIKKSEISGYATFDLQEKMVSKISLMNYNFGKNDYLFNYKNNDSQIIYDISGANLDLASLVKYKLPMQDFKQNELQNSQININIANAGLMNKKNLHNLYANVRCTAGFCANGEIKASYNKNQSFNFIINKVPKKNRANIKADISNVSYLIEGLGITNLLKGGDIKLKAKNEFIDNKNIISGEFKSLDKVTFFETTKIRELTKNTLFLEIRDAVFSSGKTIFSNMSGEFIMTKGGINIKSFVANNFKVGITAKGKINLSQKSFDFKGMIVPGFIVNNLFGIGKIPVVGNVVSGLLTGGEEGGGIFGIRYSYSKKSKMHKEQFKTEKIKSFIPSSIKSLFD